MENNEKEQTLSYISFLIGKEAQRIKERVDTALELASQGKYYDARLVTGTMFGIDMLLLMMEKEKDRLDIIESRTTNPLKCQ